MNQQIRNPKYLHYAVLFFAMFMLGDQVLMYRLTQVGPFNFTAGVFLMPLYYFTSDLIAEVYGFQIAKRMIVAVLICCIVFALLMTALIHLPIPTGWDHAQDYNYVLGNIIRSTVLGIGVAVFIGSYVNAYIISKLKILTNGRIFILRCIGASAVGELIQNIIGCLLLFTGVFPFHVVRQLIIDLYVIQVVLGVVVASIGSILVRILKRVEGDFHDTSVDFNPFAHQS